MVKNSGIFGIIKIMSGHSKWETTRRQKSLNDSKRAKSFTRVLKKIVAAAKQGGGNMDNNFLLRTAVDNARALNVPSLNIESAIKKGLGVNVDGKIFEEIFYEVFAPYGVPILVQCFSDNRNRLISELRLVVERNRGRILDNGSISWQFDLQYKFSIGLNLNTNNGNDNKWNEIKKEKISDIESFELNIMEISGVLDFSIDSDCINVFVSPDGYNDVKEFLGNGNYDIVDVEITYVPKTMVSLSKPEELEVSNFVYKVEEIDDVKDIYVGL